MITKNSQKKRGFAALITAIILSLIMMLVTVTLNQTGFFTRSNLLDSEYKERSAALAEACVDVALLELSKNPSYSGNVSSVGVGGDSCSIRPIASSRIETQGIFNNATTNLCVVYDPTDFSIVSWDEVASFPCT